MPMTLSSEADMGNASANAPSWQDVVADKRRDRASRSPQSWLLSPELLRQHRKRPIGIFQAGEDLHSIISARELDLTDPMKHDAVELLGLLESGSTNCVELTTAFCKRATIAHQLTNCLTEILFSQAIQRARELDDYEPAKRGPLHGLPVTVKDSFFIAGHDSSVGLTRLCNSPAQRNSQIVDMLQAAGAVIIAKTTVPQTMLTADTDSVVHGRTVNAHHSSFGAGGSTGGEGALLAMGGTSLGIGTDGAGSVRMPAFVNGVIGMRTSGYRWPLDGVKVMGDGLLGSTCLGPVSVAGPLCRSVRDLQMILRVISEARPWIRNPFCLPSPWLRLTASTTSRPLRIGVWSEADHKHVHLLPPVARAFKLAQTRLTAAPAQQFTLHPFHGPSVAHVWSLQKSWATEVQDIRRLRDLIIGHEPITEIVRRTQILQPPDPPPVFDLDRLHHLNLEVAKLVRSLADAWVDEQDGEPLDALLWVPAPHPAVEFDEYTDLSFTGLFNIVDWPAVVLPVGRERVSAEKGDCDVGKRVPKEKVFEGGEDARVQRLWFGEMGGKTTGTGPERYEGLPLSVQLIGRRGEDEWLAAVAERVERAIS